MSQMTIYLPDEVEERARKAAKAEGKSVSRWIAAEVILHLNGSLPPAVLDAAGIAPDFPDLDEIRASQGADSHREPLS